MSINETSEVESSAGLCFTRLADYRHFELGNQDFIFVPGLDYNLLCDNEFLTNSQDFFKWLRMQVLKGTKICSICTGAFLLAEAGIFTGKSCTTHWKYFNLFRERFADVDLKKDRLFVVDGNIYSSAGVSSGIDLALYIIEEQFGTKLAVDIAKEVVLYFRRSKSDPQLSIFLQYRNHLDLRIHGAQNYISEKLSNNPSLEEVADFTKMGLRNFTRCFKKVTGITVGDYIEKLRVERAFQLLSLGNKVDFVSIKCGLKSPNQLRSILKKHNIFPESIRC